MIKTDSFFNSMTDKNKTDLINAAIYLGVAAVSFLLSPLLSYLLLIIMALFAGFGFILDIIFCILFWWAGFEGGIGMALLDCIKVLPPLAAWLIFMVLASVVLIPQMIEESNKYIEEPRNKGELDEETVTGIIQYANAYGQSYKEKYMKNQLSYTEFINIVKQEFKYQLGKQTGFALSEEELELLWFKNREKFICSDSYGQDGSRDYELCGLGYTGFATPERRRSDSKDELSEDTIIAIIQQVNNNTRLAKEKYKNKQIPYIGCIEFIRQEFKSQLKQHINYSEQKLEQLWLQYRKEMDLTSYLYGNGELEPKTILGRQIIDSDNKTALTKYEKLELKKKMLCSDSSANHDKTKSIPNATPDKKKADNIQFLTLHAVKELTPKFKALRKDYQDGLLTKEEAIDRFAKDFKSWKQEFELSRDEQEEIWKTLRRKMQFRKKTQNKA